jgi:hypothetical protein
MKVIRSVSNTVQQNLYNTFVSMLDRAYRYVSIYIIVIVSGNFTFVSNSLRQSDCNIADVAKMVSVLCTEKARSFHCAKKNANSFQEVLGQGESQCQRKNPPVQRECTLLSGVETKVKSCVRERTHAIKDNARSFHKVETKVKASVRERTYGVQRECTLLSGVETKVKARDRERTHAEQRECTFLSGGRDQGESQCQRKNSAVQRECARSFLEVETKGKASHQRKNQCGTKIMHVPFRR